jgi:hypothetical protein
MSGVPGAVPPPLPPRKRTTTDTTLPASPGPSPHVSPTASPSLRDRRSPSSPLRSRKSSGGKASGVSQIIQPCAIFLETLRRCKFDPILFGTEFDVATFPTTPEGQRIVLLVLFFL